MKSVFKYVNNLNKKVDFILEPWAEEFQVLPGQEVTITGNYDYDDTFCQLEQDDDDIVFYAWEHSLVKVEIDGDDVTQTSNDIRF